MSTITREQRDKISAYLKDRHIPSGLGTKEEACSIAAINLALTGELTDEIPDCMSRVIGKWIIVTQDDMPDKMRNSAEWRALLPLAAGTGREHEKERLDIILDWMWSVVLPSLQGLADEKEFGLEWKQMLTERTAWAAWAVAEVAEAAAGAAAWAAWAAGAAAGAAAWAAAEAVEAAGEAARAAEEAARAAAGAAEEAAGAGAAAEAEWEKFNPTALLKRLCEVQA